MSETTVVNLSEPTGAVAPTTAPIPAAQTESPAQTGNNPAGNRPDEMASKFAALAKKERYARQMTMQAKSREEALAKREAAIAQRERQWDEEFRSSPLEALKKRNINYQDITNAALNDGKFSPDVEIKSVRDEITRLRQENEQKEKQMLVQQQRAQAAAESEAIEGFKSNITNHIGQNTEKYELTKLYDGEDLVFQTVEEHFNRTQKILSVDEACQLVEQYLESELERTSKESKKFQSKFLAQQVKEDKARGSNSTTLTNNLQSSSAPSLLSPKTENDRIQRALAALSK